MVARCNNFITTNNVKHSTFNIVNKKTDSTEWLRGTRRAPAGLRSFLAWLRRTDGLLRTAKVESVGTTTDPGEGEKKTGKNKKKFS